jgi:hypothetical protein
MRANWKSELRELLDVHVGMAEEWFSIVPPTPFDGYHDTIFTIMNIDRNNRDLLMQWLDSFHFDWWDGTSPWENIGSNANVQKALAEDSEIAYRYGLDSYRLPTGPKSDLPVLLHYQLSILRRPTLPYVAVATAIPTPSPTATVMPTSTPIPTPMATVRPQPTSTAVPLATVTPILPIAATPNSIPELIRRLLELSYVSLGNYYVVGQDGQYLGVIDSSKNAADSICSTYGPHGSKYSPESMRGKYSEYGSKYGDYSARSRYASKPPLIIQDVPGTTNPIVGVITINKYAEPGLPQIELDDLYSTLGCL